MYRRTVAVVFSLLFVLVVSNTAHAEFAFIEQCESLTATSWWNTALYRDDRPDLFRQENFPELGIWRSGTDVTDGVRDCFGSGTPHSRDVLLHWVLVRPEAEVTQPNPILLVPGAGDNGKRTFTFMAYALAFEGYNVFALTFAHSNGDNFQHAEQIANAIAVISDLYDGVQVDVVAHSMGGIATRLYASHDGSVEWGEFGDDRGAAYAASGTRYRGDIRKIVFLGTPQLGADTSFRWPNVNFTRVLETPVNAPISWDAYYPLTTANLLVSDDFTDYGYFSDQDYYPGQSQLISRLDGIHRLPGEITSLGTLALQQDWFTTYEGGFGFYSESQGVDAAVERGGRLIEKLEGVGVDPDIEVYIAVGRNPILPLENGALFLGENEREQYGTLMESEWPGLERNWFDDQMPWHQAWGADVDKVFAGEAALGEISGPSDGIIFEASVTHTDDLTARGAEVVEVRNFDAINHLELTYAGRLAAFFFGDEETAGELLDPIASAKYDEPDNQVVEWVDSVLHTVDPEPEDPDAGMPDSDAGPIWPEDDAGTTDVGDDTDDIDPTLDTGTAEPDVPGSPDAGNTNGATGGASRSGCHVAPLQPSNGLLSVVALLVLAVILRRR